MNWVECENLINLTTEGRDHLGIPIWVCHILTEYGRQVKGYEQKVIPLGKHFSNTFENICLDKKSMLSCMRIIGQNGPNDELRLETRCFSECEMQSGKEAMI